VGSTPTFGTTHSANLRRVLLRGLANLLAGFGSLEPDRTNEGMSIRWCRVRRVADARSMFLDDL